MNQEDMERASRLERLLALEIRRLIDDLQRRRDLILRYWGAGRIRTPFLDTAFHRYRTIGFSELLLLDEIRSTAIEAFYRELDELRFYLAYTDDMPHALGRVLDSSLARLAPLAADALVALNHEDPFPERPQPPWSEGAGWGLGAPSAEE